MELDRIGEKKTALFMIMSDTDGTFNFILAMMQSQMFNLLCECAVNTKLKLKKSDVVEVYNMGEIKPEAKPA